MIAQESLGLREVPLWPLQSFPLSGPTELHPVGLTLDITHACPFRCPGCIEAAAMSHSRRACLHRNTISAILKRFKDWGGQVLQLYGGEPTAHPDFADILMCAAGMFSKVELVTNGAFLNMPQIAGSIISAANETQETVRVSLNAGTAKTHALLHGAEDYFTRVVHGMNMLRAGDSNVNLGVSFLVEEANVHEIVQAYDVAVEAAATAFWLRPKSGPNSIGLILLSNAARTAVCEAILDITSRCNGNRQPELRVEPWFIAYLEGNAVPDTAKPYTSCFYCAAARIVITPPDPGEVWSCTYRRADARFHVASLSDAPLGSEDFERQRVAAIQRISPPLDCAGVICMWNEANLAIWEHLKHHSFAPVCAGLVM